MFLRTTEFLWQEGHTAHATAEEAVEETMRMLDVYADFVENWLAMPVIKGEKTAGERFPGAVQTFTIEAMMQDRKALQAGTSHFLGQNFAKASEIKFLDQNGEQQYAWTTSWGSSTRLIGAMLMTHSDDDGLVRRRSSRPLQVVIIPIWRADEDKARVLEYCRNVAGELRAQRYVDRPVSVMVDERDERGGDKVWNWIKKGVPLRLEIGPRDMEKDALFVGRRDRAPKDKQSVPRAEFVATVAATLQSIQDNLYAARQGSSRAAHASHRFQGRVLRVVHGAARPGERADADPRRLRADALQWRREARRAHQERPGRHRALHSAGEERAGDLSVHRPAQPAARRVGESLLIDPAARAARTRAWLQLHFCVVLWGFTAIFGRLISLPALPLVWWRMTLVGVALLAIPMFWRGVRGLSARQLAIYAGIGVLVALHWLTFYGSIKLSNASVGATCMALMSVLMAFIEPLIVRRKFDPRELLFGLAVIPGVLLVIGGTPSRHASRHRSRRAFGADPLCLRRAEQALHRQGRRDDGHGRGDGRRCAVPHVCRTATASRRSIVRDAFAARRIATVGARDGLHAAAIHARPGRDEAAQRVLDSAGAESGAGVRDRARDPAAR